ncbi:helix-turn-helix transcriptional regulator [Paenibacillus frigoriresistens]|uniref:helix-turn-helix domain-containing protein n=1 Tax=Paenibacillus alginolyticus TaxID=59839 RepID=UPI001564FB11|nr:AraC family transcriptional regulator [Paenibacillus frigoriresistens]NRF95526.1 helix-turn-helix transcriptional regulator [Paenibacillus frigoriresistens]
MPNVSVVTGDTSGWSDVKLSGVDGVPPQEAFEPVLSDHLLVIHLTPQPVRVFERADGYSGEGVAHRGDINLFSAGDMSFCRWEKDLSFIRLDLPPALTNHVAAEMELPNGSAIDFGRHIRLRDDRVVHLAQWLMADLKEGEPGGKLYTESLIRMLSVHLLQRYGTVAERKTSASQRLVRKQLEGALDYIHAHLEQEISLGALAAAAHVSSSHLVRLFREAMGLPPHQYVLQERIRKAQQLLLGGNAIHDVAVTLGFSDQSHLHHHFKRILGVTPREFLRQSR